MQSEQWARVKSVFDSAVLIAADGRAAYLDQACSGDTELRTEVESLLAASDSAEDFLEIPFAGEIAGALFKREAADELRPDEVFGRYKITRKIGFGGMGKIYLAEDRELKRPVAIKFLSAAANLDTEHVARFVQEARLASLLNHPNILTIYEIGHVQDLHFISTEFVPGETLRSCLARAPLETERALDIVIDIASALVAAHRAEIVHRDIKPENVMLRDDGLLKILDFGLAKLGRSPESFLADENPDTWGEDVRTGPGFILGTPTYMSPEQALGGDVDARTDIWSLGVILYEMIAGRPPFEGASPGEIVRSILHIEPKPLTHPSPGAQSRLRYVVGKALRRSPDDRYQTMREFLDDVRVIRNEIETGAAERRSIAILPFTNVMRDEQLNFFEFALADAVITGLGRSCSLTVRPSSSIFRYLGIPTDPVATGRELGVDVVLAANILVSRERIRVTAQLIDVNDKGVLWGDHIDVDRENVILLQDEITNRIVEGLRSELHRSKSANVALPTTGNSRAYVEYLRGRDQLRTYMFYSVANKNVELAARHFERAIQLDPNFALAHYGLGTCYMEKVLKVVGVRSDVDGAIAALDRALELDPSMTEARAYRSFIRRLDGDLETSRREMAILRRDAPNNFEVQYLSAMCYRFDGDYDRTLWCYREMLRIDPTAQVAVHYCRARIFLYRGDLSLAARELDLADKIEPNHPLVKFIRAVVTFRSGNAAEAVNQLRQLFLTYPFHGIRAYLSICLGAIGEYDAALSEITEEIENIAVVDPDVSYWIASANIIAGRLDVGLDWLERSVGLGNHDFAWFERDSVLEPVRHDSRYLNLISRLKHSIASA